MSPDVIPSPNSPVRSSDGQSLSIAIPDGVDTSRLYIDSGGHDMGGVCQDGWITTRIRELGASYELKLKQTDKS